MIKNLRGVDSKELSVNDSNIHPKQINDHVQKCHKNPIFNLKLFINLSSRKIDNVKQNLTGSYLVPQKGALRILDQ